MTEDYSILATCLPIAVLLPVLGIPLIMGLVPRNGLYGFRVPLTLSDDRIWYPVNRSAGWYVLGHGILLLFVIAGTAADLFDLSMLVLLLLAVLFTLIGVALGILQARRIKRALDARSRSDG